MAVRNIDRLVGIVNDLLDLSKIDAGKMPFRFADVDLRFLIDHLVSTYQSQAEANSLSLKLDCPEALPRVYADEVRIGPLEDAAHVELPDLAIRPVDRHEAIDPAHLAERCGEGGSSTE